LSAEGQTLILIIPYAERLKIMNAASIAFVSVAAVALLLIARAVYGLVLGQSMTEALIHQDNKATGIALSGFLMGVIQVIIPVLTAPGHTFWSDVRSTAAYGIGGILAMTVSGLIFALYSRSTGLPLRQQINQGNAAAGIVAAGEYLAVSSVVKGALTGDGGSFAPTIVFWAAGIAVLIVLTWAFHLLTSYDDAELINKGNIAAAIGQAGLLIALGLMVGYSVSGNFTGYREGFASFGLVLLIALILYPVRQIVVQTLLLGGGLSLRNGRLDREIAEDQNVSAGILEAVGYISTALLITNL
jgi:uncharacterized membrane protein YjfL (UPF0719 family)